MNGDKAAGAWTPWPVDPGQLEMAEDDYVESEPGNDPAPETETTP